MALLRERLVKQTVKRASFTRAVKQVEQLCAICGQKFWGASTRKYCSQPCRQKANYQRHAEEYRQQRRAAYRRQKTQAAKG